MTILSVERLSDLLLLREDWQQLYGMLEKHYREVATFKDLLIFNPDLPRYQQLEREQRLHIVIMRQDSAIVGYSVHVIANGLLHYRNIKVADDDIHYLVPHLRGTGEHARMRRFAMQTLKGKGVQLITARSRFGHEHDKALKDIGFEPWDLVYACDLTRWEPPAEG